MVVAWTLRPSASVLPALASVGRAVDGHSFFGLLQAQPTSLIGRHEIGQFGQIVGVNSQFTKERGFRLGLTSKNDASLNLKTTP
jgi:hypothetical protein